MRVRASLFFLSFIGVFAVGFAPSAWAYQIKPCVELLNPASGVKVADGQSLSDSELGRQIYKELKELVGVHPDTYVELRKQASKEHYRYRDLLIYMRDDRARIVAGLEKLVQKSEGDPVIRSMVAHTLGIIKTDERRDESDDDSLQRLLKICGPQCGADISSWFQNENLRKDIEEFSRQYYAKNYSFISELLTALEVKGFVGIGFHLNEIFSTKDQKRLMAALKAKGLERLATLEIDVGAKDKENHLVTWFEVKHVSRRIEADSKWWMRKIRSRIEVLQEFIDVVKSDPELAKAWPYSTDFRFVIRGAGISEEARELLKSNYGIIVYDREISGFNNDFGQK